MSDKVKDFHHYDFKILQDVNDTWGWQFNDKANLLTYAKAVEYCNESMKNGKNLDTLLSVHKHKYAEDGDVPSKTERDELLIDGLLVRVVGEDFWAVSCTYFGGLVVKAHLHRLNTMYIKGE